MDLAQVTETRAHNEQRRVTAGKRALEKRALLAAQRRAVADARGLG